MLQLVRTNRRGEFSVIFLELSDGRIQIEGPTGSLLTEEPCPTIEEAIKVAYALLPGEETGIPPIVSLPI